MITGTIKGAELGFLRSSNADYLMVVLKTLRGRKAGCAQLPNTTLLLDQCVTEEGDVHSPIDRAAAPAANVHAILHHKQICDVPAPGVLAVTTRLAFSSSESGPG